MADNSHYRWTVLVILTLVYTFNFIDRQILVILQEPIKFELGLSDAQLGLLTGFSFALAYVTAGIPIAWLADRSNRRNIVAASLAFWSLMTALSGLVQNFAQLLAAVERLKEEIERYPGTSDIQDSFKEGKLEMRLALKPQARVLGLTMADLARQVRAGFYEIGRAHV